MNVAGYKLLHQAGECELLIDNHEDYGLQRRCNLILMPSQLSSAGRTSR